MVIPSEWYENAPLASLEALAMGTPLIASDIGGLSEIAREAEGSLLFTPGDERDLAEKITQLWNSRDSQEGRSLSARRAYESRYTPSLHIDKYLKVFNHT